MNLETKKINLFIKAIRKYRYIQPLGGREFNDCYTIEKGKMYFWFNILSGSTKCLDIKL